jgi:hypothetical protein
MRVGDVIRCLLMSQGSRRIDNGIQKSSRCLQGCTHAILDQKASTSSREQQKQEVVMSLSRIHSRGIRYLHSCSRLKHTCVLRLMMWCCHNAHSRVQGECGDAIPSTFSELSKNALYQQTTVEGSLMANRQGFGREESR